MKCSRIYKKRSNTKRHLEYECGKEAIYKCYLCFYQCKRPDAFKMHLLSKKHKRREQKDLDVFVEAEVLIE